jgi:hypothetical protein
MKNLYIHDVIFLIAYVTSVYFFLKIYKNVHRVILYIAIPFLLGCILYVSSDIYRYIRYGSIMLTSLPGFLYHYLATGFWAVGILSGLIDIVLSYIIQKNICKNFEQKVSD